MCGVHVVVSREQVQSLRETAALTTLGFSYESLSPNFRHRGAGRRETRLRGGGARCRVRAHYTAHTTTTDASSGMPLVYAFIYVFNVRYV